MSRTIGEIDADIKLYQKARDEYQKLFDGLESMMDDYKLLKEGADSMHDGYFAHYTGNNDKTNSGMEEFVNKAVIVGGKISKLKIDVQNYINQINTKVDNLLREYNEALNDSK
ncbi:MAG: hypothetical protein IKE91_08395 [Clostridia bacterium]|nr:hypothetical protein [Clostridia bacterium]